MNVQSAYSCVPDIRAETASVMTIEIATPFYILATVAIVSP